MLSIHNIKFVRKSFQNQESTDVLEEIVALITTDKNETNRVLF